MFDTSRCGTASLSAGTVLCACWRCWGAVCVAGAGNHEVACGCQVTPHAASIEYSSALHKGKSV